MRRRSTCGRYVLIGVESKKWAEPRKLVLMDVTLKCFTPLAKRPTDAAFKRWAQTLKSTRINVYAANGKIFFFLPQRGSGKFTISKWFLM